jgi:subtilisin family serine protease
VIVVHAGYQGLFFDTPVAIALAKLVSLGARIVNMSIGGREPSAPILVDAIHQAAANGVLIIAAAGNDNGYVGWPAADLQPSGGGRSYGLAVGATDVNGQRASFSDWGKHLSVVAPGDYGGLCSGVLVALPAASLFDDGCFFTWTGDGGARYGDLPGTSFAAPEVTGVAALIWAARPGLKNYEVADIIKQSARRTAGDWTPEMGCGILDAGAALELATSRPATAWTEANADGALCSAAGPAHPAWPTEVDQKIRFKRLPDRRLGDSDFVVHAAASSSLPVSFAASGYCTIRRATVHLTGEGACVVRASQAGNAHFKLAPSISRGFLIASALRPRHASRR